MKRFTVNQYPDIHCLFQGIYSNLKRVEQISEFQIFNKLCYKNTGSSQLVTGS